MDTHSIETAAATVLRDLVRGSGRTLREVSRAAGFSDSYLSVLLRGKQDLKFAHVGAVLRALGVDPGEYFRRVAVAVTIAPGSHARRPTAGRELEAGFERILTRAREESSRDQEALDEHIRRIVREEMSGGDRRD